MNRIRILLTVFFVFLIASSVFVVKVADADPIPAHIIKDLPIPEGTEPIKVLISSPENHSSFTSNSINIFFSASVPKPQSFPNLTEIWSYYESSWFVRNEVQVNNRSTAFYNSNTGECDLIGPPDALKGNVTLLNIPVGSHHLEIKVLSFYKTNLTAGYKLSSSATVYFTVFPNVTISSIENKTYASSDLPLGFLTDSEFLNGVYSLDNHANVTINGNTTLTGLSKGSHCLVVYSGNGNGNFAMSDTLYFTVSENLYQELLVPSTVIVFLAAAVGVGLFVHFRKRNVEDIADKAK